MAESFEIGDGFVKITSKVDDSGIKRDAEKSGTSFQSLFTKALGRQSDSDRGRITSMFSGTFNAVKSAVVPIMTSIVPAIGAVTAAAFAIGPVIGSAVVGVVNFGAAAAAAAPAALLLRMQMLAAFEIIKSFGPEMLKAMSPVTDALKESHQAAAELAADGLRPLAKEFVRVNMGSISTMLMSIAADTNKVAKGFLNWANSVTGMKSINSITRGIADLVRQLAPSVQGVAISFVAMLGRISEVSTAAGGNGLAGALDKVNGMLDRITAQTVRGGLDQMKSSFIAVRDSIMTMVEIGQTVWSFYQRFRTQIQLTVDALGIMAVVFGGPVTAIVAGAGLIIRHWDLVKNLFAGAREWFTGIEGGSAIMGRLRDVGDQVWAALKRAFDTIRTAVAGPLAELRNTIQNTVLPAFGNLLAAIGPLIPVLIDRFAPAVARVVTGFIKLVDVTLKVISAVANVVAAVIDNAGKIKAKLGDIVGFFRDLPGKVGAALSSLPGKVGKLFASAASKSLYQVGYLIGSSIRQLKTLPGRVRDGIAATPGIVSGMFTRAASAAKTGATRAVSGAVSFFKTLPGKSRSAISSTPSRIKSVFSGAGGWLKSAGANILKGLVAGMKGAVGAAKDQAVSAAKSVISGMKAGLGINSPSKVAEKEVGRHILPGVSRGVTKSVPATLKKVTAALKAATLPKSPTIGAKLTAAQVAIKTRAATTALAAAKARAAVAARPNVLAPSKTTPATTTPVGTDSGSSEVDTYTGPVYQGTVIQELAVNVRGVLDPTDQVATRRMIAQIYEELAKYERSFA